MFCADSTLLPPLEAPLTESQSIIEGIRHRILAYLYRERSAEGPGSGAVRRFFFHFQEYATLIIWKASSTTPLCDCITFLGIPLPALNR